MLTYCEINIPGSDTQQEVLIAELAAVGFTGFEETDNLLKAYISEADFVESDLNIILNKYNLKYSKSILLNQNWNTVWESHFEPVQVDDFVGIRASFHPPFAHVTHEIIITPKMSFGTGHHATTYSVMQLMRQLDFMGTRVFDFGTGTGILAILAEQMGAERVWAVDNDDWSIENASENISINNCEHIEIEKVNTARTSEKFQIILANITKNILTSNLPFLQQCLAKNGQLILSGLLKEDEADIISACSAFGMLHKKTLEKNGWIACLFLGENL